VREPSLFGFSLAGRDAGESHIDPLTEFLPNAKVDVVEYAGLMLDFSKSMANAHEIIILESK